ncbi:MULTISPECIES: O-methyltransferase [Psychrobacter]|uniref:O-methyltransferase n=1 Tax=Psychrobacter alimentarius TaxID=261164 RepID=A0ABN4N5J7_9GAMM|nr:MULTISPECIES: class I SAM-dependent methyltransferase [Psychrobacter]AMT97535.1 O-methyltransferase [Psychrobacter alimentarius]QCB30169.1 methyltransferase domain-containing protein [Psychrobacter sp. PAMC27889]
MSLHDYFERTYFLSYCQSLYNKDRAYDVEQTDRLNRHRHVEPDSAQFLANIAMIRKPNKVLEIGTSTGFSTLWLAYGLRHCPNVGFISLDIDKTRSDVAKSHLQAVGLSTLVDLKVQDASDYLSQNREIFDFIFLDAERKFYSDYTEYLHCALTIGSVLIVDNVISHSGEVNQFLAVFKNDKRYICHTLDIGAGLFMAVRQEP